MITPSYHQQAEQIRAPQLLSMHLPNSATFRRSSFSILASTLPFLERFAASLPTTQSLNALVPLWPSFPETRDTSTVASNETSPRPLGGAIHYTRKTMHSFARCHAFRHYVSRGCPSIFWANPPWVAPDFNIPHNRSKCRRWSCFRVGYAIHAINAAIKRTHAPPPSAAHGPV